MYPEYDTMSIYVYVYVYEPIFIQAMTQSIQDDDVLTRLVLRNKQTYQ